MAAVEADLQDLLDATQLQALIVAGRNILKSADFAEEEVDIYVYLYTHYILFMYKTCVLYICI
jgi:hypothetical protein